MSTMSLESTSDLTASTTTEMMDSTTQGCSTSEQQEQSLKSDSDSSLSSKSSKDFLGEQSSSSVEGYFAPIEGEDSQSSTRRNSIDSDLLSLDSFSSLQLLFATPSLSSAASSYGPSDMNSPHLSAQLQQQQTTMSTLEDVLTRLASERLLELQRIQQAARPVPPEQARSNLEHFFHTAIHGPSPDEDGAFRAPEVTNDLGSLLQQAPVQQRLQTSGFRARLEALFGNRSAPAQPRQPAPGAGRILHTQRILQQQQTQQQQARNQRPVPAQRRNTNSIRSSTSRQSHSSGMSFHDQLMSAIRNRGEHMDSTSSSDESGNNTTAVHPPEQPQAPPLRNPSRSPNNSTTVHPASTVPHAIQNTIQSGMHLLEQAISEDIDRLHGLQIVSSMLDGGFRNTLERLVRTRVEQVGNGPQVQQAIRNLAQQQERQQTNTNNAGAHQNTFQVNQHFSNEMDIMKRQVDEMKQMLSVSLELQMDTQRAIRQEVSAVFAAFMSDYLMPRQQQQQQFQQMSPQQRSGHAAMERLGQPAPLPTGGQQLNQQPMPQQPTQQSSQLQGATASVLAHAPYQPSKPVDSGSCVICIEKSIESVLYTCGHMCCCMSCAVQLKVNGHKCPMCRAPIRDVIRAYQAQ